MLIELLTSGGSILSGTKRRGTSKGRALIILSVQNLLGSVVNACGIIRAFETQSVCDLSPARSARENNTLPQSRVDSLVLT